MLSSSLKALGKAWDVDTIKTNFPYTFVNEDNLNYIGPTPLEHYDGDKPVFSKNWNMRD